MVAVVAVSAFVVGVAVERPPSHESVGGDVTRDLGLGEEAEAKDGEGENEFFHGINLLSSGWRKSLFCHDYDGKLKNYNRLNRD